MHATDLRDPSPLCSLLSIGSSPETWRQTWPRSGAGFTAGEVFFLQPGYVREVCALLRISDGLAAALGECAAAVAAEPLLQRLAWHLHWLMSLSGLDPQVNHWPALLPEGGPANALLYGLVVLAGVPRLREINGARGIAEEVTIETLSDLETWAGDYHAAEGVYRLVSLGWMQHHLHGRLFKLGRLEYIPGQYSHSFRWYRNDGSQRVVALAEPDLLLREDGQFASADGHEACEGLWKARLEESLESVSGYAVSPRGRVTREFVTLDTAQWREVLRRGDPVMTVHIPAKGGMAPEECGASFRQAVAFYRTHFPEVVYRAFTCQSWLLDPQFEQFQPPPPNICAFLREWYLHPVEGGDDSQAFQRLFDLFGKYGERRWDEVEAKTTLQRATLEFIRGGGRPRGGGSVLFPEDLDWGKQVYRQET